MRYFINHRQLVVWQLQMARNNFAVTNATPLTTAEQTNLQLKNNDKRKTITTAPKFPPTHLAGDGDLLEVLETVGAGSGVTVVEDNGDAGLGNPRLALLVDELLQVAHPDMAEVREAQHKTNRVQNVRLAAPVEPGDRVEGWVEIANHCEPSRKQPRQTGSVQEESGQSL